MTGTDLCVNKSQFVPVIFEPPCIRKRKGEEKEGDAGKTIYMKVIYIKLK